VVLQILAQSHIENVVDALSSRSVDVNEIIFQDYILAQAASDSASAFRSIEKLFRRRLGFFSKERIRQLLVPEVAASLDSVIVGLQFPPSVLREVDFQGDPLPGLLDPAADRPTLATFEVATVKFSSAKGLEFDVAENLTIELPRSEVLKTGIILKADGLKVDFSRTTNIQEATADGRPGDFGVVPKSGTTS
jgi:hypothetical protein